jgi:NhaA family Na+:H+ antiporter
MAHPSPSVAATRRLFGAVVRPLTMFVRLEASSGILLLGCAAAALVWANVHPSSYAGIFDYPLGIVIGDQSLGFSLRQLVNDGLMAVFFLVVGMEIKRELVAGELNTLSKASLPAIAALGGMVIPAGIYVAFNWGGPGLNGWGIPMATDIAFCVGILTLLKARVPRALVVFLTALAIFDDIGGILVIAIFYGHDPNVWWLLSAVAIVAALLVMNRAYVVNGVVYAVLGAALWYALHEGGIHASIAGVVLGLAIPARPPRPAHDVLDELRKHVVSLQSGKRDDELGGAEILAIEEKLEDLEAPGMRFQHILHPYVAFGIMPLFALANSGVLVRDAGLAGALSPISLGAALGLLLGKPIGIFIFTICAVKLGVAHLPRGATLTKLFGISIVAGIGFTVALFIAALAFPDAVQSLEQAKIGILLGSFAAGTIGYVVLRLTRAQEHEG